VRTNDGTTMRQSIFATVATRIAMNADATMTQNDTDDQDRAVGHNVNPFVATV
jgi:hypothetical protein